MVMCRLKARLLGYKSLTEWPWRNYLTLVLQAPHLQSENNSVLSGCEGYKS